MSAKFIGKEAFSGNATIQKVILSDNVAELQDGCFKNSKIRAIRLSKRLSTIGSEAFRNCANLKKIELCDGLSAIQDFAFAGSGIQEVSIPGTTE